GVFPSRFHCFRRAVRGVSLREHPFPSGAEGHEIAKFELGLWNAFTTVFEPLCKRAIMRIRFCPPTHHVLNRGGPCMSEHIIALDRRAFLGGAVALGVASLVAPTSAFAETAAEKQAEADAVRNQLVGLQADLEAATDNYYKAVDERDAAKAAMEAEQVKIDETNEQIADLQDKLSVRARDMYRSGSSTFLDFVLGATSFAEFTQNWGLLNRMNENDADMVDETKALREELQASKDEYARQEQIAADKAAEAKAIQE